MDTGACSEPLIRSTGLDDLQTPPSQLRGTELVPVAMREILVPLRCE